MAFTIISGILIAMITFGTVVYTSKDARTAFFGLEELRGQIRQAKNDLNSAREDLKKESEKLEKSSKELESTKSEIKELLKTRENLKKEVEMTLSRRVIFTSGDVIYSTLVKGGQGKEAAELELYKAIKYVNDELKKYNAKEAEYEENDYDSTVSYLANMDSDIVLRIIANRNLSFGGTLAVRFDVQTNQLLYRKGEEIERSLISGKLSAKDTEQRLKDLLSKAEEAAGKKGMLPGGLGAYPYEKIYDSVRRVRGYGTLTRVSVLAASDVYTIGPLVVEFKVQP